ncbi:MAG: type III restriction endonuclease subunit R, partial [Caldisericia bacterium]|nr:type III restriction endonuclease subunit R [Caldisericia bacterium]
MAIPKDFPRTPFAILDPDCRWYPGKQLVKSMGYERLLPPLVYQLRKEVKNWRDSGYKGASKTSKSLLTWWFDTVHKSQLEGGNDFQYFFAQREAIETIIYLHEIAGIKTSKD